MSRDRMVSKGSEEADEYLLALESGKASGQYMLNGGSIKHR